jgi:hypothetical protein
MSTHPCHDFMILRENVTTCGNSPLVEPYERKEWEEFAWKNKGTKRSELIRSEDWWRG